MRIFSRIFVNQSNANIRVGHVKKLNATQIGGTINNNVSPEVTPKKDPGKTPQNSYAIGVVNWSDYGLGDDESED